MNFDDLPPRKRKFKPKQPPRRLRATNREPDGDDGRAGMEIGKNGKPEGAKDLNSCQTTSSANSHDTSATDYPGNSITCALESRGGKQKAICLPSTAISTDVIVSSYSDVAVAKKIKKDYVEPWDYNSYYPTTLPLRRPFSGMPKILNDLEFGENQISEPDESSKNHATELGLHEEYENPKLFFVQLPEKLLVPKQLHGTEKPDTGGSSVPMEKADPSARGKEIVISPPTSHRGSLSAPVNAASASTPVSAPTESNRSEGSSGGHIGKMLVYKSGKVKWKIGETLSDVAPGIHFENDSRDLVAMNTKEKTCCKIGGELEKKMIVTPDVDFLLDSDNDLK